MFKRELQFSLTFATFVSLRILENFILVQKYILFIYRNKSTISIAKTRDKEWHRNTRYPQINSHLFITRIALPHYWNSIKGLTNLAVSEFVQLRNVNVRDALRIPSLLGIVTRAFDSKSFLSKITSIVKYKTIYGTVMKSRFKVDGKKIVWELFFKDQIDIIYASFTSNRLRVFFKCHSVEFTDVRFSFVRQRSGSRKLFIHKKHSLLWI